MDEMRLRTTDHRWDGRVTIISETWLHENISDTAVELAGRGVYRSDRTLQSGKTRGGGVCVFINNNWCKDVTVMERHCCAEMEFLLLKCRLFYLPREFTAVFVAAVYVHPQANARFAMKKLYEAISAQQNKLPDSLFIVAGDFNHSNLKSVLPKFHKYIKIGTRKGKTLDQVYTNIKGAYRALPAPHLGQSDHLAFFLRQTYRSVANRTKCQIKTVQIWTEETESTLQDCFEDTMWDLSDIEQYTTTVLY